MKIALARPGIAGAFVAAILGIVGQAPALAQLPQCYSVECRARGYDPVGLRIGTFFAYPRLWAEGVYDDNIYVDPSDGEDDFIAIIRPSLDILNNWRGHRLHLRGFAEHNAYIDNESEDHTNAGASARFDLEMLRSTRMYGAAGFTLQHEKRGSPNDVNGDEPTPFTVAEFEGGIGHRFNRLELGWYGRVRRLDYIDVDATPGQINMDDRDRDEYATGLKTTYDFSPGYAAVLEGAYRHVEYDDRVDDLGIDRDSDEYILTAGVDMEVGRLVSGKFRAGVIHRRFDQPGFDPVTGLTGSADLYWNPLETTTVNLFLEHSLEETTVTGASVFQSNRAELRLAQEIRRNLLGVVSGGLRHDAFEDIDREDETWHAEARLRYFANRHVAVEVSYRFESRTSDVAALDFDRNIIGLRIRTQY